MAAIRLEIARCRHGNAGLVIIEKKRRRAAINPDFRKKASHPIHGGHGSYYRNQFGFHRGLCQNGLLHQSPRNQRTVGRAHNMPNSIAEWTTVKVGEELEKFGSLSEMEILSCCTCHDDSGVVQNRLLGGRWRDLHSRVLREICVTIKHLGIRV